MTQGTKFSIFIVVALLAFGLIFAEGGGLFKGQLSLQPETVVENAESREVIPPDLMPQLKIMPPAENTRDIIVEATIKNIGEGDVRLSAPFSYTISINGTQVLTNTDSYSSMQPGDEFSFSYPIPRSIYNYAQSGTIEFAVDTQDVIPETNEQNNKVQKEYSF